MTSQEQETTMTVLTELSNALADAVEAVSPSMALVDGRRGYGATGLAWKQDGLIVTANHVVQRDQMVQISIDGGDLEPAELVGRDRGTDIAVLRVGRTLDAIVQPVENPARVGNLVLALGSQAGAPAAASFGVVATINRPWRSPRGRSIDELIRSDVTLYPGFSGGPLVDASGRVVGMNTSALTRGLAATLPWSLVEEVAGALVSHGSVKRGYLGVASQLVEIPEQMRSSGGIEQETGLIIINVEPESPAAGAGLMLGDILIQFGDRTITDIEDLHTAISSAAIGRDVTATVIRGGARTDVRVVIGER
jgi:S1-C subfamily serine protease